jgi:hypothetical protein
MAELPRYRPLGVALAPAPRIDYAGAGAAEARGWQSMSQALDRMSSYAFEEAGKRAEREGEAFGYKLEVTPEQLKAAAESGRSIDDIVGDPGTIFGAASRASVGLRLKTQLEGQAREDLSTLAAMIEGGERVDTEDLKVKIDGMMAGHADVLSQIDPKLAYNYRATVGTLASSVYKNALEQEYKLRSAALLTQVDRAVEQTERALQQIYKADKGATKEVDGVTVYVADVEADLALQSLLNSAIETNDVTVIGKITAGVKELKENAKINALREFARENMGKVDLNNGVFGDKTALYQSLDEDGKAAVRNAVRDEKTAQYNAATQERLSIEALDKKMGNMLVAELQSMPQDDPRRLEVFNQLDTLMSFGRFTLSPADREALQNPQIKLPQSNPYLFHSAKKKIVTGQFRSESDVEVYATQNNINVEDRVKLIEEYQRYAKAAQSGALRIIQLDKNVLDPVAATPDQAALVGAALRDVNRLNDERNQERASRGEPLETLEQTAQWYIGGKVDQARVDELAEAKKNLIQVGREEKIEFNFENADLAALKDFQKQLPTMSNLNKSQRNNIQLRLNAYIKALEKAQ